MSIDKIQNESCIPRATICGDDVKRGALETNGNVDILNGNTGKGEHVGDVGIARVRYLVAALDGSKNEYVNIVVSSTSLNTTSRRKNVPGVALISEDGSDEGRKNGEFDEHGVV